MSRLKARLKKLESKIYKGDSGPLLAITKKDGQYFKVGSNEVVPEEVVLSSQCILVTFVKP